MLMNKNVNEAEKKNDVNTFYQHAHKCDELKTNLSSLFFY